MNSVAVLPQPQQQPSAAVHAAMQRSAMARQAVGHSPQSAGDAFVSRAAQMQTRQATYYASTRSSRANSRDRSFTDSTNQQSNEKEFAMDAALRPRVTRAVGHSPEPYAQSHYQVHQQQYHSQPHARPHYQHHHQHQQHHQQYPQQYQPHQQQYQQRRSFTRSPSAQALPQQRGSFTRSPSAQPQFQQRGSFPRSPSAQPQSQQRGSFTRSPSAQPQSQSRPARPQPQPQPQPQPPVAAAAEWRVAVDPKTKRPYYYHPVTRQTTWKKPAELVAQEKRERASFFSAMESNIRAKLRDGNWFRDSLTARPDDLDAVGEDEDDGELSSSTSTSSRSSWSSTTTGSVASLKTDKLFRPHQQNQQQRSTPASPEFTSIADDASISNQFDHDSELLLAAAAKPPLLFRTLSSYETPVVGETKKLANGRVVSLPSPIQERVLLAGGMDDHQPRCSDLEAYTRPDVNALLSPERAHLAGQPLDDHTLPREASTVSRGIARQPLRRRSNSTSTIYVRMGTMNAPDQDTTIQCVATVLRAHLMEAQAAPLAVSPKFEIFVNRRDERANAIPSLKDIGEFIRHVFARAQMESECIIMSLIYVERLLKATMGSLQLLPANWRAILFCSMVMASKVWDDLSMCNADFSKIWPELSLKEINDLELAYLSAVEYNVRVSAVSYAKYYFHLRSMCASMGMLKAFDESAPLNLDGARKMQVLSEEYQERSKLMPTPSRRRSVTITTPSSAASENQRRSAAADGSAGASGWSPSASLEQLVQMQSRVAGGTSLATMHRLSTSSASPKN